MTQPPSPLHQILVKIQEMKAKNERALCVFDLDSTLFDVSPRIEKILLEFAENEANQQRFPEYIQYFKGITTRRTDWGVKDSLMRAGLDGDHPELQEAVRQFWIERFFSNEYLQYDVPYEGAVDYVQRLFQIGCDIVYLTGRDVFRMGRGSEEILRKWQFPMEARAHLVLKPHREMEDAPFKTNWFARPEVAAYDKVWFFENEPVNINHLRAKNAKVEVVFFDSTHSRKERPPEDVQKIIHYIIDGE